MKQYRRMIYYLYQYLHGEKGTNVGYIRMEQQGASWRMQIQMRRGQQDALPEVAFFKQQERGVATLPLGNLQDVKGQWCFRIDGEKGKIGHTPYGLDDMDGILIYISDAVYYASAWKNEELYLGEREMLQSIQMPQTTEQEIGAKTEAVYEERKFVTGNSGKAEKECEKQTPVIREEAKVKEVSARREKQCQEAECGCRKKEYRETEEEKKLQAAHLCQESGRRLMEMFPSMNPFGSLVDWECVRIEPKDIGCLPMKWWFVSGNPFLLQGYCNYRHLLLVKKKTGQYGLGVPGIYSTSMAQKGQQAGFVKFQSVCGGERCTGAFGYWMMPLDIG